MLTTINALDPIYFAFDGSEALFLKTRRTATADAQVLPLGGGRQTAERFAVAGC